MSSSQRSSSEPVVRIARSKAGEPYAQVREIRLHSAYDPKREARRFIEGLSFREPPSVCVVLGEAFGYLSEAVRSLYQGTRVLSVCYDERLRSARASAVEWDPSRPEPINQFFDKVLGDLDVEGLEVIEWPPSTSAFPQEAGLAREALAQTVRERTGSLSTIRAFGPRWARNTLANFLAIENPAELDFHGGANGGPVVIAASGPSLEEALPLLASLRERLLIIALPSSLAAFAAASLGPDLLVATDAGYWASLHLAEISRLPAGAALPVAMPLSAARGIWRTTNRVVLLNQGSLFEHKLLATGDLPSHAVSTNGTVAAVALEIALELTRGPVIFAGLDLCFRDIREHVRPHSFDPLWATGQSRLDPLCGTLYRRAVDRARYEAGGGARISPAFRTYAGWLARGGSRDRRVFRLNPTPVDLPGFTALDAGEFRRVVANSFKIGGSARSKWRPWHPAPCAPTVEDRVGRARALLRGLDRRLAAAREAMSGADDAAVLDLPGDVGEMLLELDAGGLLAAKRAARLEGMGAARKRLTDSIEGVQGQIKGMRELYLYEE